MYKRVLLISAFVCAGIAATAQPIMIDSVENNNMSGMLRYNDGMEVYAYYIKGAESNKQKTAKLIVKKASPGLQEAQTTAIDIDKNTMILGAAASPFSIAFLSANTTNNTCSLFTVDFSGNILQKTAVNGIVKTQMVMDNDIKLYSAMPEGFITIVPDAKIKGYAINAYNNDLNSMWSKSFSAGRHTLELLDSKLVGESLVLLRRELIDPKQQKYTYSLQIINTMLPDNPLIVDVNDKGNVCYANALNIKDGVIGIAGLCYKDGKYVKGIPAGMGLYQYQQDGTMTGKAFVEGEQLTKFLPDAMISSIATNSSLIVTDFTEDMGKNAYYMVCELIQKNVPDAKKAEAKVKVADLMTIVIGKETNEIEKLTLADKTPELNLTLKGQMVNADLNSLANWLQKNKLVNTRFSVQINGAYYVCIKGTDAKKPDADAIFIRMDDPSVDNQFSMLTSRLAMVHEDLRPMANFEVLPERTDRKLAKWKVVDIINLGGSKMGIFNTAQNRMVFHFEDMIIAPR